MDYQAALLALLMMYTTDEDEIDAFIAILPYLNADGTTDYERLHAACVPMSSLEVDDAMS